VTVCGVIAEYDPFHKGHAYHLQKAREITRADYIICVISGSFTQRGLPALLPAHARAQMALSCGADIVLQLPYAFSVREAEFFALGGVYILNALSCVTHLSFGCERDDLPLLQRAAQCLEHPDAALEEALRNGLDAGLSHAQAQGRALEERLHLPSGALNAPNTALALSYLRALIRLDSPICPAPVQRTGDYHALELQALPSATALRGAILRGDWAGIEASVPASALPILRSAILEGLCPPDGLDSLLRARLLTASPEEMASLPGMGEGLEMRILKAAETAVTRSQLIELIKTRRYTHGRISRALCHALMQINKADLPALPSCARILGFRQGARPLLRKLQEGPFPLVTRPAREAGWEMDIRADELRQIGAGLPRGLTYRQSPVIMP